jgi:phosphate transport system substrate-binding protein
MNVSTSRKSVVSAALIAVLALTLSACGGSSNTASSDSTIDCTTGAIKASGSTAQKNAIAEWVNAYQTACPGGTVNYQGVGSSAGVTDFINKQTVFAGSDSTLKPEDQIKANKRCIDSEAIHIPMVGGAITLAYNVAGVDSLTLTPDVIAGIFNNSITKWNDPKIKAINEGVSLPDATIAQFHRSDGSGTTDNFTKYLTAAAPTVWKLSNAKEWKADGGQGAKGNDGVAAAIKSTDNAIGYVELSFAQDAALKVAKVDNGGGAVEPNAETAAAAINKAVGEIVDNENNIKLKINYTIKDANTYPIVLLTYEITCQKGLTGTDLALTKSFLTYTSSDAAQAKLVEIGYVPITGDLLTSVRKAVSSLA